MDSFRINTKWSSLFGCYGISVIFIEPYVSLCFQLYFHIASWFFCFYNVISLQSENTMVRFFSHHIHLQNINLQLKIKGKKWHVNHELFCKSPFPEEISWGETTKSASINWIGQVPVEQSGKKGNTSKNVFNLDVSQVYISIQKTAVWEEQDNWCHSDIKYILDFLHI